MKKVISVAAAAALTASAICVPAAMVSAADTTLTDAFVVVFQDQTVALGKDTVKVPVCFDKDVTFATADMKFSAGIFPKQEGITFDMSIESIESALPATSGITVDTGSKNGNIILTGAKNFTLKKGEPIVYVNAKIKDTAAKPKEIPSSTTFRISLDDLDIVDEKRVSYEVSDSAKKRMSAVVQVVPEAKEKGCTAKLGSVTTSSKEVDVPVFINADITTIAAGFKVDGGAQILSITPADTKVEDMKFENSASNPVKMLAYYSADSSKMENISFKGDSKFALIKVKLPDSAKSSDKFNVSYQYVDMVKEVTTADKKSDGESIYPETVSGGVITYEAADMSDMKISEIKTSAKYVISEETEFDLSEMTLTATMTGADGKTSTIEFKAGGDYNIKDYFEVVKEEGTLDRTLELKYTGPKLAADVANPKVEYLRGVRGDATLDGEIDVVDATIMLKEAAKNVIDVSIMKDIYLEQSYLKDVISKYGIDTVTEFGKKLADIDESKEIDVIDATLALKYAARSVVGDVVWSDLIKK